MSTVSLRTRLLRLLIGGALAVTVIGAVAVDRLVESRVARSFDEALVTKASVLMTLTKLWPGEGIEFDFADEFMPEFTNLSDPAFFQVQLEDGRLVELSESFLFEGVEEGSRLQLHALPADQPRIADVELTDGRNGRQVQVDFRPQLAEDAEGEEGADWRSDEGGMGASSKAGARRPLVSIAIAVERESLDSRLLMLRLAMIGLGLGFLACLALLSVFSLELGLAPVHRLAHDVEALDERSLDTRLEVSALPRELRPIGEQLNGLLDRIGDALQRERQLTSDIAHDLKTPVAELRALCDVGARWPDDKEATARFFEDARDVARTLERTIEQLLALARHDAGRERVHLASFDLAELLRVIAATYRGDASRRGLELQVEAADSLSIDSDRDKVGNILGNLIENAVEHSAPESAISCELDVTGTTAELRVSNPAPGLTQEDLSRMFERFWRKDDARGGGAHAGLGLALARADAELLDASLEVDFSEDRFTAILRLPGVQEGERQAAARLA